MPKISKKILCTFTVIGIFVIGFSMGWITKHQTANAASPTPSNGTSLRLDGYKFTSPLLACDTSSKKNTTALDPLKEKINEIINERKNLGQVDAVAVYFRDFNNNTYLNINPDDKFYPASLNKIPVMIAAFKEAEVNPQFLSKKIMLSDRTDQNIQQEIKPKESIAPGEVTTVENAIEKMIRYSDNNAFYLLAQHVNQDIFKSTYTDLRIPMREDATSSPDYVTAEAFSYFFRVLYNATYLNRELSEKALQILSRVDFKEGLVADIPAQVTVAHKFGLQGNSTTDIASRELHDCGIVYRERGDYLLCVMTKSSSTRTNAENTIKAISNAVYGEVASWL